jgi:hypothetical protein
VHPLRRVAPKARTERSQQRALRKIFGVLWLCHVLVR